jgi:hypothetical protein
MSNAEINREELNDQVMDVEEAIGVLKKAPSRHELR